MKDRTAELATKKETTESERDSALLHSQKKKKLFLLRKQVRKRDEMI